MKGEKITHEKGVYTAARDPQVETYGEDGMVLVRYTHQFTPEILNEVWRLWSELHCYTDRATRPRCFRIPPPRLRWRRVVPCNPYSYGADAGFTWTFRPAQPGAHGAFPCIEFDTWVLRDEGLLPPRIVDVHLPDLAATP